MFRPRHSISFLIVAILVLAATCVWAQTTDLPLGGSVQGTITSAADVHYYRITPAMAAGQHLVALLDKQSAWNCSLYLRYGGIGGTQVDFDGGTRDLAVERTSTDAGYYYLEVRPGTGVTFPVSYTVTALTADMLPTLTLGTGQQVTLAGTYDRKFYRVCVPEGQHLVGLLDKHVLQGNYLWLRFGSIKSAVINSDNVSTDQVVETLSTQAGCYYLEIFSGAAGTSTVTALTADMLPTLTLGTGQQVTLAGTYDRKFYRVCVPEGQHLIGLLDKPAFLMSALFLRPGGLTQTAVDSQQTTTDLAVEALSTQAGCYYLEIANGAAGTCTLTALTADMLPTLTLGVTEPGALDGPQDRKFYRVPMSAGQHLMCFMDKTSLWVSYLYLRYGGVGTPNADSAAGNTNLAVEALSTSGGDYYLEAFSTTGVPFPATYTMLAVTDENTVTVRSVTPGVASNTGPYAVTVRGTGFQAGAAVTACLYDSPATCVAATDVTVNSPSELTATLDFSGFPVGSVWDLFVTNPDTRVGGLRQAISVADIIDLPLGQARTTNLSRSLDVHLYRITPSLAAGQHLYLFVGKPAGWAGGLYVRHGAAPDPSDLATPGWDAAISGAGSQAVDVPVTQAGDYYVMVCGVPNSAFGYGPYTIAAHTDDTWPALPLGSSQNGTVDHAYDARWYRVEVGAGEVLAALISKESRWYGSFYLRHGALPTQTGYDQRSSGVNDFLACVPTTQAGTYYLMLRGAPSDVQGYGNYSVGAHVGGIPVGQLSLGQPQKVIVGRLCPQRYQVNVPAGAANLFVTLQNDGYVPETVGLYYGGQLLVQHWGLDALLSLPSPAEGVYDVEISGAGSGILMAGTSLPELVLGQWHVGTILHSSGLAWYQVNVPLGQASLFISAEAMGVGSRVTVYRGSFGTQPVGTSTIGWRMNLQIPSPEPGMYYLELRDSALLSGSDQHRNHLIKADVVPIEAPPCDEPTVASISPTTGGTAGPVTVAIQGRCFDPAAAVCLRRAGHADICAVNVTCDEGGHTLLATFDLTNADPGEWTLVVVNPDSTEAVAPVPFTAALAGAPDLWVEVQGRSVVRIGRWSTFVIRYGNRGTVDAALVPLRIEGIPADVEVEVVSHITTLREIGIEDAVDNPPVVLEDESGKYLMLLIANLPAGSEGAFEIRLSTPMSLYNRAVDLRATLLEPWARPVPGGTALAGRSQQYNIGGYKIPECAVDC